MTSSRDAIRQLRKAGFEASSQGKGSHTVMKHPDGRLTVIPKSKDLGVGLKKSIERQSGVRLK